MAYRIKNWQKFQHYKERKPPWIKLYRELLDDIEWFRLSGDASKVLVMLWLIGSENQGELPEVKELAFRLRISEQKVNDSLSKLSHWLEHDDRNALASRKQDATLETERETEKEAEKETETERKPSADSKFEIPPDLLEHSAEIKDWLEYKKQRGQMYKPKGIEAFYREFRAIPPDKRREAVDWSMGNNWSGLFVRKENNGSYSNARSMERINSVAGKEADKFAGVTKTIEV